MKSEYKAEDFTKAIKNPYFSLLNKKLEVAVTNESYEIFKSIADENGVKPEIIMTHCLEDYAKMIKEDSE
jgi:hypothetical protein